MKFAFSCLLVLASLCSIGQTSDFIYIGDTETNNLRRCDSDGSNMEVLFAINSIREVDVDPANDKVYFIDADIDKIQMYDIITEQISDVSPYVNGVNSMYIDHKTQVIYFTSSVEDNLYSVNADGSNYQVLEELDFKPTSIEYDPCSGRVFYTDYDEGRILSMLPDGSDHQVHLEGLSQPKEIEIDHVHRTLYFTQTNMGFIFECDLNTWEYDEYIALSGISWASMEIDDVNDLFYYLEYDTDQLWVMDMATMESTLLSDEFSVPSHIGIASCQPQCGMREAFYCGELPYQFNDQELTESGIYTFLHPLETGCDSLEILDLNYSTPLASGLQAEYFITTNDDLTLSVDVTWTNVLWSTGEEGMSIELSGEELGAGTHYFTVWGESLAMGCQVASEFIVIVDEGVNVFEVENEVHLSLFPNPNVPGNRINIQLSQEIEYITLTNLTGQFILRSNTQSFYLPEDLAKGLYLVHVYVQDGEVNSLKLLIQ
ncbi:T9SS type A sorting domain-containing protein [Sanyastnella coralliicola]|uniref:T9SS type A sorting domain-containing protein n=1 Tax=Sanyastnella coralliicola TaxID=3069118 RepID=UPI0027BAA846|nr:T9SS type A sorting domain-containing protein [Longitalea sp. SCSIO 12813]